ncbi:slit homolog 1 protein [Gouania willdenowi]|uniref:slit homolog 1 protein n=1 Tax=Gouania willdenowi TaxID=441366 RepID=UPI001056B4A3|nr:slit homolog 1 protein-like [Gouania willdenowi]
MSVLLNFLLPLVLSWALSSRPCPGPCRCYQNLVDCEHRWLLHVPAMVPHGTWLLDLSGNHLKEVHSRSFLGLWSLRILLMSNNSLHTLHPQCLSSLQFLERLDLSYNLLRGLPWDFSHSLSSLQELRLDHNLLQHVASLGELDSLRKLDLSYNHIQSMDVGALVGLSSLSVLSLEGNRLEVLREGLLSRQQRLEVLKLGHNNVSLIEAEALTPLRKLTLLSLRGNQLTHVKFKTLLKLQTTSTHLHMSSNPWFCDCELQRVFGKIRRVRHLHVDDYEDVVCHAPAQQTGHTLASLDTRLCVAETATVLVITITVLLAVLGALVKAEQNRKNKQRTAEEEEAQR